MNGFNGIYENCYIPADAHATFKYTSANGVETVVAGIVGVAGSIELMAESIVITKDLPSNALKRKDI